MSHFGKYSVDGVDTILKDKGYDWLNKEEYINAASIIKFRCKNCGHIGHANISNIVGGRGCRGCGKYKKKSTEEFASIALNTDDGYTLMSEYITCKDKVVLRHNKCGCTFEMTPDSFIGGSRCPHCMTSHGELEIKRCLENSGIDFVQQYKFADCKNVKPLPFDFYIPSLNTCIEYNGAQHYIPVEYFGGEDGLAYRKRNDAIKSDYCANNNISLVVIPYWEYAKIGGVIDGLVSASR